MPTYDYICSSCNHEFELFQSITAAPEKKCPKCGSELRKKISRGAGLVFKGSGFYITDYKKSGSNGNGGAEGKSNDSKKAETKKAD